MVKGEIAMALLSDMRTLAHNLLQDYETRVGSVAGMRTNVRLELNNFRTTHRALSATQGKALEMHMEALRQEVAKARQATSKFLKEVDAHQQTMTAEQRQTLGEHMLSLREQVASASQATVNFLQEIDQERKTMNDEQRQRLGKQMDDLHSQVNGLRQAAAAFIGNLDKSNQSMADDLDLKLTWQRTSLATDVAAFINSISAAHQEMASQQAQELNEQSEKLHQDVSDLRHDAASFLKATNTTHRSKAKAQKQSMTKGRNQLTAEVTAAREKLHSEQNALRKDQAEAAKVWANINEAKKKSRMTKGSAKPSPETENSWIMASPAEPGEPVDDFTVIHGIGPAMAKRLSDAGITSFKQLAASKPEQIYRLLGKIGKLAKVETWILQAKELSR
jgi:predicted flap endonuclease-1-like 5' DNA nuclease